MNVKTGLEIAIVGMAGRFPGAGNLDEFWRNLCRGIETIRFFSEEELRAAGVPAGDLAAPSYVRARGLLAGTDLFDAGFFGFSPREAQSTDPQQRLFLECAWHALEDAGYDPRHEQLTVGVYAGAGMTGYIADVYSDPRLAGAWSSYQLMLGNDKDFLAPRTSYKLGLEGPSITVQTACSTSLVAVHLAVQALLNGECDMALAGGVTARLPEKVGYHFQDGMILSPDGHCRAFAAGAQGTVGGNGVGAVVLRRLEDALAAGDSIYAVIKGSAVNNDGSDKIGFTAPRIEGQAQVIRSAQLMAEVEARSITYVEGHGTATPLGDPIEVAALTRAFRATTPDTGYCALGSVKSNIGHLDAAAGVAGLIKTALALHHKQIPPSLHCDLPNPAIDFPQTPFFVNTELRDWRAWPADPEPRRAAVSSFGIGGTNAHVILEEAPGPEPSGESRPCQLLLLSAKTPAALETVTADLAAFLERTPPPSPEGFADIAHTLRVGRRALAHRRAVVCRSAGQAAEALRTLDPRQVATGLHEGEARRAVFLFPGQGAQHMGMARDLYHGEPAFREQIDRCAEILLPHLGLDLRRLLFDRLDRGAGAEEELDQTWLTQPALFVVEYALAQLWRGWGIGPAALLGHSIGEFVAACLAGVLTLEEALRLVAARGRLLHSLPPGAMTAVPLPEEELLPLLGDDLSIAAVNAPSRSTVSGQVASIEALERRLGERGVESRRLRTMRAFHSAAVEPILAAWQEQVRTVALRPPEIPYLSNVTGEWIGPGDATDPAYWVRHLRGTVRFAAGIQKLLAEPGWVFLEVGPGTTLRGLVRRNQGTVDVHPSLAAPGEQPSRSDLEVLLGSLGHLWLAGLEVDWKGLVERERRRRVPLPTYPFERQSYRIERAGTTADRQAGLRKEEDPGDWFYVPSWSLTPPPVPAPAAGRAASWLLIADRDGIAARLAELLRQDGQEVLVIGEGEPSSGTAGSGAPLASRRDEADGDLARALQTTRRLPRRIVHLGSVTRSDPPPADPAAVGESQRTGDAGVGPLIRALAREDVLSGVDLVIVSSGAQRVDGRELPRPDTASILEFCHLLPREFRGLTCRSIDLDLPALAESPAGRSRRAAETLYAELSSRSSDRFVAWRGRQRWRRTFQPLHLSAASGAPGLRGRGVYLLSDGLGRVGLALADHLARQVRARLVLTSSTRLPGREQWAAWLARHGDEDTTARTIRRLLALEETGAEILVVAPADRNGLAAGIARARETFGALHGVFHGAGAAGSSEDVGFRHAGDLLALEQALRGSDLDFCVLLSSLATVLSDVGGAESALTGLDFDTFAEHQHRLGASTFLSLACESWQGHQECPAPPDLALSTEEGIEAVIRALAMVGTPRLVVSTGNLELRLAGEAARPAAGSSYEEGSPPLDQPQPLPPVLASANETESAIGEIWHRLLGVEQIGREDDFFRLGGDSLLATRLVAELGGCFGVEVPLRIVFDMPTIAAQAAAVAGLHAVGHGEGAATAAPTPDARQDMLDQMEVS